MPYTTNSHPGVLHTSASFQDSRGAPQHRIDSPRQGQTSLPHPFATSYLPALPVNSIPPTQSTQSYPPGGTVIPSQNPSAHSYYTTQASEGMAVHAAVNRHMYPPLGPYQSSQASPPVPMQAAHPELQHRAMYGQNFAYAQQMFGYPQYAVTNQPTFHSSPQNYSPVSPAASSVLISQQHTPSTLHSSPSQGMMGSPRTKVEPPSYTHMKVDQSQYSHFKVEPPFPYLKNDHSLSHPKSEHASIPYLKTEQTSLPHLKMEQSLLQRPLDNADVASSPTGNAGTPPSGSVSNSNAAPGPIPATTPLVVRQDQNGVQWIAFEYSRDRVKMEYTIRCDVESVVIDDLTSEFKSANCVYPGAYSGKEGYKGNRLHYESECNAVGWALAHLNPALREKRGLIQRAVDSWRNSNQDPRLRSRRVRRQAKINTRKSQMRQTSAPISQATAELHSATRAPPAMPLGPARLPSISGTADQLHHHHSALEGNGGESVSAMNDIHTFTNRHGSSDSPLSSSPTSTGRRDSYFTTYSTSSAGTDNSPESKSIEQRIKEEDEEKKNTFYGDAPERRKRKFILVDDFARGTRVRVHVELDNIKMEEMPDFHLRKNSVFPRSFYPRQMRSSSDSPDYPKVEFEDDEVEYCDSVSKNASYVPVALLDGSEVDLPVPDVSKGRRYKECALNELGYRMSWRQAKIFNERRIFMQKSLDAYRNKMLMASTAASYLETRLGKRRWTERHSSPELSP